MSCFLYKKSGARHHRKTNKSKSKNMINKCERLINKCDNDINQRDNKFDDLIVDFINIQFSLHYVECVKSNPLKRIDILEKRGHFLHKLFLFLNEKYCSECRMYAINGFNSEVENTLLDDCYINYRYKLE